MSYGHPQVLMEDCTPDRPISRDIYVPCEQLVLGCLITPRASVVIYTGNAHTGRVCLLFLTITFASEAWVCETDEALRANYA